MEPTLLTTALGNRYRIERELGRGGMGTVYLARDRQLERSVALKVLPAEFTAVPELRARFLRETRLAAGFSHPNIVPVFAIEEQEHVLAFAMGFVEGESLAARVARAGPLTQREAIRLLQDVAYALAYAHGRGVVHRDIKPDNIMIERATGRALVMDFGIARTITQVPDQPGLTRVGEVVGTPEYMSPEQATGDAVDGRADLYSLGLVAWFALAGRTVFTGETTQRILVRQLTEAVPSLASVRSDLPDALCAVVDRCCAKEPAARFPTAEAMVEALDATQLATPDVPVAVRLLVPELTAIVVRAAVAVGLLVPGIYRIVQHGSGNVFSLALVAIALTWVKTLGTVQELRRLRGAGFTGDELQRLLGVVQGERDGVRAQRRLDPVLVARRRRRVIIAGALLVVQMGLLVFVVSQATITDGDIRVSSARLILTFFASLLGAAIAIILLASSPFRRPLVEQMFGTLWLGRLGRAALRVATGRDPATPPRLVATSGTASAVPVAGRSTAGALPAAPSPSLASSVSALAEQVRDLQHRVTHLERTRD